MSAITSINQVRGGGEEGDRAHWINADKSDTDGNVAGHDLGPTSRLSTTATTVSTKRFADHDEDSTKIVRVILNPGLFFMGQA